MFQEDSIGEPPNLFFRLEFINGPFAPRFTGVEPLYMELPDQYCITNPEHLAMLRQKSAFVSELAALAKPGSEMRGLSWRKIPVILLIEAHRAVLWLCPDESDFAIPMPVRRRAEA